MQKMPIEEVLEQLTSLMRNAEDSICWEKDVVEESIFYRDKIALENAIDLIEGIDNKS